jgi:hypothetical protein
VTYYDRLGAAFREGVPLGTAQGVADATSTRAEAARSGNYLAGSAFFKPSLPTLQDNVERTQTDPEFARRVHENQAAAAASDPITRALAWSERNIFSPVTDYYEAVTRKRVDDAYDNANDQNIWRAGVRNTLSFLGAIPGLAFTDREFRDHYYPQARANDASIAQTAWELASLGDRDNKIDPTTGRAVLPLVDDPGKEQDRMQYFASGPQKWITGIADGIASTVLDPTNVASGGLGAATRAARVLRAADITEAAATSRAARLAASEGAAKTARGAGVAEEAVPEVAANAAAGVPSAPHTVLGTTRRLQHNVERNTDAILDAIDRRADGTIAARPGTVDRASKLPLINRSLERGPLARAATYVASTYSDRDIAAGMIDDIQWAALGDRDALARMESRNLRMATDFQALFQTDRHGAEQFILSDPRLSVEQKDAILHNDDLFEKRRQAILGELSTHISDVSRTMTSATQGVSLDRLGELGAAGQIDKLPLTAGLRRTMSGVQQTRVAKSIRFFRSTGPINVLAGMHVPETMRLTDDAAPELFDAYLRRTSKIFSKRDQRADVWGKWRDAFTSTRGPIDPDLSRTQRQEILHHVNSVAAKRLANKYARLHNVDPDEVRVWIDAAKGVREKSLESLMQHARRAVDMDSPLVWRDPVDGQWYAAGSELAKQISGGQTQAVAALIDWKRMDTMLSSQFRPGLAASDPTKVATIAGSPLTRELPDHIMGTVNDLWKFGALFRPAYGLRNQMDVQLRTVATAGALEYGLTAMKGVRNWADNLKYVKASDVEFFNSKREAMREIDGLDDALERFAPADVEHVRQHGYKPDTMPAGAPKAITDGSGGKALAVREQAPRDAARIAQILDRQRELRQTIEMSKRDWERMLHSEGLDPNALGRVRRGKTAAKKIQGSSESMDFKSGAYTPYNEFDAYTNGWESLSQRILPNAQESVFGLLEQGRQRAIDRAVVSGYQEVEYGTSKASRERWANVYADTVNRDIRNDKSMMMMLLGARDEDIIKWLRDPLGDGPEYWRARQGRTKGNGENPRWRSMQDFLAAQREHVDNLVPNQSAADTIVGRDISPEDVAAWYADGDTRPLVPAKIDYVGQTNPANHIIAKYDTSKAHYFHLMSTLPEGIMGRHPTYQRLYNEHVRRLAASIGHPGGRDTLKWNEVRNVQKRADALARRDMADIVFDTSHVSNLAYHVRFLSQFYSAWSDTMRKWGHIFAEHPMALPLGYQGFSGLSGMFLTKDGQGHRIMSDGRVREINADGSLGKTIGYNFNPMSGKLVFHLPSAVKKWAGTDTFTISRGSLNAIFQGENPFLPPTGPLVTIPINEALVGSLPIPLSDEQQAWVTAQADNPLIENWLNPYGQTDESKFVQAQPNWLRAMNNAIEQDGPLFAQTYSRLMGDELNRQQRTGEFLSGPETRQKVANQARNWWVLRFIGTWAIPASTAPQSKLDWYITKFRDYQKQGVVNGVTAEDRFMKDFPDYGEVIVETSKNESGIAPSEAAWKTVQPWRKEIAHAPDIGWMFAGDANYTGQFSDAVYTAQKRQKIGYGNTDTFRQSLGEQDSYNQILEDKGWREWMSFSAGLDERLDQLGLASLYSNAAAPLREVRDQFLEDLSKRNPAWATAYQKGSEEGPNPVGDFLNKAYGALSRNPDLVTKRQDLSALNDYFHVREAVRQQMQAMGYRSADGAEFQQTALFQQWQEFTKQLRDNSNAFQQLYARARLERDNLNSEVVAY